MPFLDEPNPIPQVKSIKTLLLIGALGHIVCLVAIAYLFSLTLAWIRLPSPFWRVVDLLLAIGMMLASSAYLGIHRRFDSTFGKGSFIIAIISGIGLLFWIIDYNIATGPAAWITYSAFS